MDAILELRQLSKLQRVFERPLNVAYIDIKAVFDSVEFGNRRRKWIFNGPRLRWRRRPVPREHRKLVSAPHHRNSMARFCHKLKRTFSKLSQGDVARSSSTSDDWTRVHQCFRTYARWKDTFASQFSFKSLTSLTFIFKVRDWNRMHCQHHKWNQNVHVFMFVDAFATTPRQCRPVINVKYASVFTDTTDDANRHDVKRCQESMPFAKIICQGVSL